MNSQAVTQLHVLSESGRKRRAGREGGREGRKIETGRDGGGRREQWIPVGGGARGGRKGRSRSAIDPRGKKQEEGKREGREIRKKVEDEKIK